MLSAFSVSWTDVRSEFVERPVYVSPVQLYEVVPCQSDCDQYAWVAEPWSLWKVTNVDLKQNCGEGVQTRKVRSAVQSLYLYIDGFFKIYIQLKSFCPGKGAGSHPL